MIIQHIKALTVSFLFAVISSEGASPYFIGIDYLYWKPCPDGIYVAIDKVEEGSTFRLVGPQVSRFAQTSLNINSQQKFFDLSAESGFRIRFGTLCPCETALAWTSFHPTASRKLTPARTHDLIPYGTYPRISGFPEPTFLNRLASILRFEEVKGKWDLDLDLVDVEFKTWILEECLLPLSTTLGLRVAKIEQEFTTKSFGQLLNFQPSAPDPLFVGNFSYKDRFASDFWGVGPRIGGDLNWEIGCGCGIYTHVATSFVYGYREGSRNERANRLNSVDPENDAIKLISRTKRDRFCLQTIAELGFGLFGKYQLCEGVDANISAGWELLYFYDQGVTEAMTSNSGFGGDANALSLQGLTLAITVGF